MTRITEGELPHDTIEIMQNNLHRALINNAAIAEHFYALAYSIHANTNLPGRIKEFGILRVSAKLGSDFEFSHHFRASQTAGVSPDEARAIRDGNFTNFSAEERAILHLADAIDECGVTDEVWAAAAEYLTPVQMLDFVNAVGFYGYASRLTCALDIQVDDGFLTIAES